MKILVCGSSGQLGSDCVQVLQERHKVWALSSKELDITDPAAVNDIISRTMPDIVLNCAAYTKVDECETEKDLSWRVNAVGPKNLASGVERHGGLLVHISTDYIFDGHKRPPECYYEDDKPSPLSFYGKTKLAGEEGIRDVTDRHIILRTGWLYGAYVNNFLKTMLRWA